MAAAVSILGGLATATIMWADDTKRAVTGLTRDQVPWFTPSYYKDGRQRAQMFGDSSKGGEWIDRVKIPGGLRVLAHTDPDTEIVTLLEGTWYLGTGGKFDETKFQGASLSFRPASHISWRPRKRPSSSRQVAMACFARTF